jgi:hypothetical protein
VGITFEAGLEGELGGLGVEGIVVNIFKCLLVIENSIFSHFCIYLVFISICISDIDL